MLSSTSRILAGLVAASYAVLGVCLYLAPAWAAPNFAWNVSPFVAMTIGGWCIGNAWAAFVVARRWRFSLIASAMAYLALFGVLESGVVFAFMERLRLDHWLAWLYIATLCVNVAAAAVWLRDLIALRPGLETLGRRSGAAELAVGVLFIAFVGFLGLYGLLAPQGSRGLGGSIFPEVLTPFSLRAFGAFYLAVALTPFVLLVVRGVDTTLSHMYASWPLIFFITLAAFIHIGLFDFAAKPGQFLYIGVYVLVGAWTGYYLLREGTGASGVR